GVNVVEIDLLRRGARTELGEPLPEGDYFTFVFRANRQPADVVDVYAWNVRRQLPAIRVPLRPPDEDVMLDLAGVVSTVYERGAYARKISYDKPLRPPLSRE